MLRWRQPSTEHDAIHEKASGARRDDQKDPEGDARYGRHVMPARLASVEIAMIASFTREAKSGAFM